MKYEVKIYNSISDFDIEQWDEFIQSRYFLTYHYLKTIESSTENMAFRYAIVVQDNVWKALLYFQILPISGHKLESYIPNTFVYNTFVKRFLNLFSTDLLVLGNVIFTCEHGVLVQEDFKGSKNDLVVDVINQVNNTLAKKTRGIMISEILTKGASHFFENKGYKSFRVEDRMEMKVNDFETFDIYKSALISKYRVRLNKIYQLNEKTETVSITPENYAQYHEKIVELFQNVLKRASFNLTQLNENYFYNLLESQKRFKITGYTHQGVLVGFISYFHLKSVLEVHYIGLDYTFNETNKIYNYILYKMIDEGIISKVPKVCFSRTSQELKSTLGCYPVNVYSYLKINNKLLNRFTPFFLSKLTPKDWEKRNPFKNPYNNDY